MVMTYKRKIVSTGRGFQMTLMGEAPIILFWQQNLLEEGRLKNIGKKQSVTSRTLLSSIKRSMYGGQDNCIFQNSTNELIIKHYNTKV